MVFHHTDGSFPFFGRFCMWYLSFVSRETIIHQEHLFSSYDVYVYIDIGDRICNPLTITILRVYFNLREGQTSTPYLIQQKSQYPQIKKEDSPAHVLYKVLIDET